MALKNIVARFKDNHLLKGKTTDFYPNAPSFHLQLHDGQTVKIEMENLKAVFFVKDQNGNSSHKEDYRDVVPQGGIKIKVQFFDGESVIGYSLNHLKPVFGFFMKPADLGCNNERIFVIISAVDTVDFL